MNKRTFSIICILVAALLSTGCKQEDQGTPEAQQPVSIKLGHVGHDHHSALYVALDNAADYLPRTGIDVKTVEDRKLYQLWRGNKKVADVEVVKVGGGSEMPTALAQGVIDVGLGGVAPVLASIDNGAPIRLIAPLHHKGDMFVVRPDFPAQTWAEFVTVAKAADKPLRIGYKDPVACAKVIFEEALRHEGLAFAGDPSQTGIKVHMVNVQGGGKLNVALSGELVDGYVGNNPFPAIAVEKGMGRVLCDLEDLPPGTFRNHPCCCIAARADVVTQKSAAVTDLLALFLEATGTINSDFDKVVTATVRWIGTSETVERMSIPTSGYAMDPSEQWHEAMAQWASVMDGLGVFRDKLKGKSPQEVAEIAYDFSLLVKAKQKVGDR
ncbi:MAG: ABC transporter substrate-binding protein [Sedimentisphaerales bacterium]|nr:ABC transporter substrate-binding protein [Sedimentisphaerales bacterium]